MDYHISFPFMQLLVCLIIFFPLVQLLYSYYVFLLVQLLVCPVSSGKILGLSRVPVIGTALGFFWLPIGKFLGVSQLLPVSISFALSYLLPIGKALGRKHLSTGKALDAC